VNHKKSSLQQLLPMFPGFDSPGFAVDVGDENDVYKKL
jgi:hypothetical protein